MNKNLAIAGGAVLLLALTFAGGRYSVKNSVETDKLLEKQKTELTSQFEERLKEVNELHTKELVEQKSKFTDTTKTTVINKDGTTTVTEHTTVKEKSKVKERVVVKVEVKEVEKIVVKTEIQIKEVIKEVTKITPPPSWRAYGVGAVVSPGDRNTMGYGAGGSYDFGPLNVGGFGVYTPNASDKVLGLTVGITF